MKNWIYGRKLMEEQPAPGGEGGGGGGTGGEEQPKGGEGAAAGDGGSTGADGGEEEHNNALGEELEKGSTGGTPVPQGEGGEKPKGAGDQSGAPAAKPEDAPTEEEVKQYTDAIKLDEEAFGKGAKLHESYASQLPAFFKKHGIAADKANAIVNDFVKMQKEVEKGAAEKLQKFREWRQGELKKMNDAYLANYDKAGRESIARAIRHFFPVKDKDGNIMPMFQTICRTEVGVDPQFLAAMKELGDRLPKNTAPGAAAGAGTGGGKSLSDSFMGL